ncbi:MAG: catalase [Isosphaeraceae bacterium]|jgi:hypothetical protein
MSNGLKPAEAEQPRLGKASTLTRFALIGVALAAVVATFAYFGGWFTPNDLTPARFTDAFEHVDGAHSGFRRNHAKGVGVSGFFESNGNGVRLSKALVFQPGRVSVIGRFSLSGGQPYVADTPNTVRGLALHFSLSDGELWRTAMINLPVFPVSTPEAFYERLVASKPDPSTGKPDPAKMKAFLARHPETVQALTVIKSQAVSSGIVPAAVVCAGDASFAERLAAGEIRRYVYLRTGRLLPVVDRLETASGGLIVVGSKSNKLVRTVLEPRPGANDRSAPDRRDDRRSAGGHRRASEGQAAFHTRCPFRKSLASFLGVSLIRPWRI